MDAVELWLWYGSLFGVGTRKAHEVLEVFSHPLELAHASETVLRMSGLFTEPEIRGILRRDASAAEKNLLLARQAGCRVLVPDDEEYPQRLRHIYSKPAALYVKGSLAGLDSRLCIAVVGSRKMSEYGCRVAHRLGFELAQAGAVVVSGMAVGIDQVSQKAAIKAEGATIGVLGCGIDVDYPKGTLPMREVIAQQGAVISEYPPGSKGFPANFPMRNRIISGLSNGVVVVEADVFSGSLITAGHALSQDRDVFAVPGRIDDPLSGGTNKLLLQGAKPVTCTQDILEEYSHLQDALARLHPQRQGAPVQLRSKGKRQGQQDCIPVQEPAKKPQTPAYLTPRQEQVYRLLRQEPVQADWLAQQLDWPAAQLLSVLTELEIYGLAKSCGPAGFCMVSENERKGAEQ